MCLGKENDKFANFVIWVFKLVWEKFCMSKIVIIVYDAIVSFDKHSHTRLALTILRFR